MFVCLSYPKIVGFYSNGAYLSAVAAGDRLPGAALAQLLILLLTPEGHHTLLKNVAALGRVTKVLHVVQQGGSIVNSWGAKS